MSVLKKQLREDKKMLRYFAFMVIMIFPVGMIGCIYNNTESSFKGNYEVEERNIQDFNAVELDGNFLVRLENSDSCSLDIAAKDEIKDLITTEVSNGVLKVRTIEQNASDKKEIVELVINMPTLDRIKVLTSAKIYSEKPFYFDTLKIEGGGILKMTMELKGDFLDGNFSGAANLDLSGEVRKMKLNIPGAARISAFDLKTKKLELNFSGAGKADVFASEELYVDVSGTCSVSYKGNPARVYSNVSGIGRVREAR